MSLCAASLQAISGVERVSIVAGGLEGWRRDELPLEQGHWSCRKSEF